MTAQNKRTVVPLGVTIGLGLFAFILSIAGYGMRLLMGDEVAEVLSHAAKVVPAFMIAIPLLSCAGAYLMNRFAHANIHLRNAWTLGWLLSVVAMLSIMGVYS
ncbi:MAG: hypothetical protein Q4C68_08005 [Moraxella sp.]|nr:hypothetical protein [Moraxella sp.]